MPRDADGREFFGFCGQRAYLPEEDPKAESISEYVLRRVRQRLLAEMLAKHTLVAGHKPPNMEFSGVPAGHSSNHPAGGTSAETQG